MAARFWVGGTGNWDAASTTHWSTSSGGSNGASAPGTSDDVTFDANSGGGTVTVTATQSVISITAGAFTGTLDTNGQTVTTSGAFNISGSGSRTITLGASTITCNTWTATTTTNLTFNANTSSITMVGGSQTFNGGGLTYSSVSLTGLSPTMNGANSFTNLTRTGTASKTSSLTLGANQTISGTLTINGNSITNRQLILSDTVGTSRTLTVNTTVTVTNADFRDITGAGTASWNISGVTGGSGDAGGNSGITFTTGATQYWFKDTGSWSTAGQWFLATNGGGGAGRTPLPQDDVVFDANSFSAGSKTVTQDMPRAGKSINWTGVTNTPTFTPSLTASIFGSLTLVSGMNLSSSNQTYTFEGRSSYTLTNGGKTWGKSIALTAPGGTLTLQDALTIDSARTLQINNGTFDANGNSVTCGLVDASGSATRTITFSSATWTITGTGTSWQFGTTTNLTANFTGSTIEFNAASQTLSTGGLTFNIVNFTNATPNVTISNANNFKATTCSITGSGTIGLGTSSVWDVTNFTPNSSTVTWTGSGGAATITSHGQSFYNLTFNKTGGGSISLVDALSVTNDLTLTQNTFTANNQNVSAGHFLSSNANTRSLTMGSGAWTLTGTGTVWDTGTTTNLTFTKNTHTLTISDTSASSKTFSGGGLTFNSMSITGGGSGAVTIQGSNGWSSFTINPPKTVTFTSGTTQTVTSFVATGTAGNVITINASTGGSAATLSDTTGTNACDYLSLQDSAATGGATWNATNSTDVSGNSGWNITPPAGSSVKTVNGLAIASVKTRNGLAVASVKTWNGLS